MCVRVFLCMSISLHGVCMCVRVILHMNVLRCVHNVRVVGMCMNILCACCFTSMLTKIRNIVYIDECVCCMHIMCLVVRAYGKQHLLTNCSFGTVRYKCCVVCIETPAVVLIASMLMAVSMATLSNFPHTHIKCVTF